MRKYKLAVIILLLLLLGAGVWYFFYRKKEQKIYVITEKPQYGYISKSVTATGTIEPVDTVTVGSQVSGTIAKIYTDFNANVKKGQLIAEMDKSLFNAQVNQYKANLEQARASLVYQKSNFDRQSLLFKTGAISKAEEETAEDQYLTAKAATASIKAQLDGSEKNLFYASIYSPVKGVVLLRNISVGQTVAASFNTPTLFVIAKDITKMQVQASVDEADIGDVKDSQRVIFTVDAYPDINFNGKVKQVRLEPVVSANVVTYTTIITAPNDDLKLRPGMTANIFVYTKEVDNAMLISSKALKFRPDKNLTNQYKQFPIPELSKSPLKANDTNTVLLTRKRNNNSLDESNNQTKNTAFVWVQYGDSLVEKKIQIGLNDDTHVQVLEGLDKSDSVILSMNQAIGNPVPTSTAPAKSPFMPTRQAAPSKPKNGNTGGQP